MNGRHRSPQNSFRLGLNVLWWAFVSLVAAIIISVTVIVFATAINTIFLGG